MYGFYLEIGDMKMCLRGLDMRLNFILKFVFLADLQVKNTNFIVYLIFSILELYRYENVINLGSNE